MRAPRIILILLALAALLGSCAHVKPGGSEQTFSLDEGQSAALSNGGRITFTNVINESRCPKGVQCIWAGTATARFRLVPHADRRDTVSVLAVLPGGVGKDDVANQLPVDTLGVSVTLAELLPYPVAGGMPAGTRHRALVRVRATGR
jgi:hypothetical protein